MNARAEKLGYSKRSGNDGERDTETDEKGSGENSNKRRCTNPFFYFNRQLKGQCLALSYC